MADVTFTRYSMFTDKANKAVAKAVDKLIARGLKGEFPRTALHDEIRTMMKALVKAGHGEVHDTEPEWDICDQVNTRLCGPMGWVETSRWEW